MTSQASETLDFGYLPAKGRGWDGKVKAALPAIHNERSGKGGRGAVKASTGEYSNAPCQSVLWQADKVSDLRITSYSVSTRAK